MGMLSISSIFMENFRFQKSAHIVVVAEVGEFTI